MAITSHYYGLTTTEDVLDAGRSLNRFVADSKIISLDAYREERELLQSSGDSA